VRTGRVCAERLSWDASGCVRAVSIFAGVRESLGTEWPFRSCTCAGSCGWPETEGGPEGARVPGASRRTPRRNSRPSLRQFLATAENCSRCHFTVSREPIVMAVLRRMQAPDGDVSSRVAEARFGVPSCSSHETSATAHRTVLGSMLRPSMPCVSARRREEFSYRRAGKAGLEPSGSIDPGGAHSTMVPQSSRALLGPSESENPAPHKTLALSRRGASCR